MRQKIGALPVSKGGNSCVDQQSIGEFVCLFFNMFEGIGFKLSKSFFVHGSLTGQIVTSPLEPLCYVISIQPLKVFIQPLCSNFTQNVIEIITLCAQHIVFKPSPNRQLFFKYHKQLGHTVNELLKMYALRAKVMVYTQKKPLLEDKKNPKTF